ncbi:uncharacterized protein V6R79_015250 [Siganus canaliculatus]
MDTAEKILSTCFKIKKLVDEVKANKKRCGHLAKHIGIIEMHVKDVKQRNSKQVQPSVELILRDLTATVESAEVFVRKYTETHWMLRVLKHSSHRDEFDCMNERLKEASDNLFKSLLLEHGAQLQHESEENRRREADQLDWRQDDAELKTFVKSLQTLTDQMKKLDLIDEALKRMTEPRNPENIRLIEPKNLKRGSLVTTTSTSEFYNGTYNGFQVLIKKYKDSGNIDPREVESTFNREATAMTQCESPNILQMYGICKQEGPWPQYLIVMELCERGSLREVLEHYELSWSRKAWMCLDAAKGLYRLHQRETKNRVHGSISSSKFLVTENFTVKLGGFKLAQTESSLCRAKRDNKNSSIRYCPPEALNDLSWPYSKECEVYSLGIVLWEIVTRRKPFDGWERRTIMDRVGGEERFKEPIENAECPPGLREVVDDCRAFDFRDRPSAGVVMDKLRIVATMLEKE